MAGRAQEEEVQEGQEEEQDREEEQQGVKPFRLQRWPALTRAGLYSKEARMRSR